MSKKLLQMAKNYLYRAIWKVEKKLNSEFSTQNSRPKVDLLQEYEFSKEYNLFADKLKKDKKVIGGPFLGLLYPNIKSYGSSIYPKLLGTYEAELSDFIRLSTKKNYDKIFVIGCAEGYYCNGLGLISNNSSIYCFDINRNAIIACKKMSEKNNISHRVKNYNEEFLADKFITKQNDKVLIICDIEGGEEFLYTDQSIDKFKNVDLMIECHDYRSVGLTYKLSHLFSKTHTIENVKSIDDLYRPTYLESGSFVPNELSYNEKYRLMKEYRKAQMSWLILTKE
jgi:hypothetical protein